MKMKKYLITGAVALIASAIMTGCHVDEDLDSSIVEQKVKTYEKLFVEEFGTIDPNQDWGFGEESALARTRTFREAITRGNANTNANEWGNTYDVPRELTAGQIERVIYYFQHNKLSDGGSKDWTEFFIQQVYQGKPTTAIGDKNDLDNHYSPEQYQAANDQWYSSGTHMNYLVVNGEHEHVNNFNGAECSLNTNVMNTPNTDFQYITDNGQGYHSDKIQLMVNSYARNFGYHNSEADHYYWDHYAMVDGTVIDQWMSDNGHSSIGESVSGRAFVGLDFDFLPASACESSETFTFDDQTYHFLINNPNRYYADRSEPTYGGVKHILSDNELTDDLIRDLISKGYRPYSSTKKDWVKIGSCRDYYYSDWIVSIAPGHLGSTPEETTIPIENGSEEKTYTRTTKYYINEVVDAGRILCEDLGVVTASDIDFNDVVLDVYIYKKTYYVKVETSTDNINFTVVSNEVDPNITPTYGADIWALAGGGTIPVTIKAGGNTYNLKNCFPSSISDKTIVNTIVDPEKTYGNDYKNYTAAVKLNTDLIDIKSIREVDIYVKYGGTNSGFMKLEAYKGVAPHKLCVPITTLWPRERVEINQAYKAFTMYVKKRDAEGNYIGTTTTNGTTANSEPYYNDTYKRENSVWQNPVSGSIYDNTVSYTPLHQESDWEESVITEGPTTVDSGGSGSGYHNNDPVLIRRRD